MACTTSMPLVTRPNTVCLPSSQGVAMTVMKNWDPFVLGPALAMDNVNGLSCFKCGTISSSNSAPQMEAPPVPVPVGSPVCIMNCRITRWNM
ncbi:hypothetical protein DERF_008205 [Dermatophagoides farinae]|uniref:Uncharacterized protein n=1 Tax=Dermatophagoides farinae TaxID=6954 RepID=A0A922I561_DERFA|nr:hypothetical protein DERF_008205 [Dermatophagoides farinae]